MSSETKNFMNTNSILLSKWNRDIEQINLFMIITMMLLEVVFYFMMQHFATVDEPEIYFTAYLIRPTVFNVVLFVLAKILSRRRISLQKKAMIWMGVFTLILANIIRVHYIFTVLYGLILVPIFLTILYGNARIAKRVMWCSVAIFTVDVIGIVFRGIGGLPEFFWLSVILTYIMLPFCYYLVKAVLRYEAQKEQTIREQFIVNEELQEELLYDDLTKIYNYTGIWNRIYREVERYSSDTQIYLALLDIDDFSELNDEFGHLAGMNVVECLGGLLAEEQSDRVSVGRYGSVEFAILFRGMSRVECYSILLSLFRKFQNSKFKGTKINRPVTFSAGLAMYKEKMTAVDFFNAADHILYLAKQDGKAQIKTEE